MFLGAASGQMAGERQTKGVVVSELTGPILGYVEAKSEEQENDGGFTHPPAGEQEESAESDETWSPDEKSG